jgi:molecular chaperone GrpE
MTDMKDKKHRKAAAHETPGYENQAPEPEKVEKGPDYSAQNNAWDNIEGIPPHGTDVAAGSEEPQEMVMIPKEHHEALLQDMEKSRLKAQEYFDGWQRERADFLNYKKRLERDQEQRNNNFTLNFIKKYLVILDDLDRALKTRPTQGDGAAWSAGVELIYRKLQNYLEMEGVRPFPTDQKTFDPTLHEAISHEASPDHGSGEIIEVVQQGYMLGDRVLRPALVRVAQ